MWTAAKNGTNFADGSFLQRNSLDGNAAYEHISKALRDDVQ